MTMTKQSRAATKRATPSSPSIQVPDAGLDVIVSGAGKPDKRLRVTLATRAQNWLRWGITPDGHQTDCIVGVAREANDLGYTSVALAKAPAEKPAKK